MGNLLERVGSALNKNDEHSQTKDQAMLNAQRDYQNLLRAGLIKPPEYNASSGKTNTPQVQSFARK